MEGAFSIKVEKILTKKVSEQVVEQIERWIKDGQVEPGEKLPSVRELCELFDVGRSAVRDAMTTLKGKGLVDVRQGEGAFVCRFDSSALFQGMLLTEEKDIRKLFHVRKILEAGIAETAARERSADDLLFMKQAVDALRTETATGWEADYRFHLAMARATQNEILLQLTETIASTTKKAMIDFHRILFSDSELTQTVFNQHFSIYCAIRDQLSEEAREHLLTHLTFTEQLLKSYLQDRDGFADNRES
ncbi:MAG TPA: FadR/GntR family transcriptional regulator [Bacillales bacterium]|nr:FadR/GntR family transcriptional regulator [Bacillales bacterium]